MYKKIFSIVIAISVILNAMGYVFAENEILNNVQHNIQTNTLKDGTKISTAEIEDLTISLEEKDDIMKYTILNKKTNKEEIVIADINKDEFMVIRDGEEYVYNRSDYLIEENKGIDDVNITNSGYPDHLGDPYYGKNLMSQSFTHNNTLKFANLKEDYYWYSTYYKSLTFEAKELVSVIVGVLLVSMNTFVEVLGNIITFDGLKAYITERLKVEHNAYEQQWLKEVSISGDRYYYASRTRTTTYNHFPEQRKNIEEVKRDIKNHDFNNNQLIMQTGIDNYIYFN